MVQYNRNLINNKKLDLSNKLTGGSFFSDLHFGWKLIIIGLVVGAIKLFMLSFFKLKINGLVFPIIFGYLGYQLYTTLTFHMKEIGLSLTNNSNENSSKIIYIITNLKSIIYSLPLLIPKIPRIPTPTFNYQPFKGLRAGIQALKVPIVIDGESFRLSINFPKLEIPFMDPLAGICCVWEQMKKLLAVVEKAIEPPKKIVKKIFGSIKRLCNKVKKFIMNIVNKILGVVKAATKVPIGLLKGVLKFLDFINILAAGSVDGAISDINKVIDDLNEFGKVDDSKDDSKDDFSGGNINNKMCLKDIFYKIHLLDYEEKIDKQSDNIIEKLSIYQIYKIQNSQKEGLIKFVNKKKKKRFDRFMKKKILRYKLGQSKFNFEKKYSTPETNNMVNQMEQNIEDINKKTYEGYNLEDLKKQYIRVVNTDIKQYDKGNSIQYGGSIFSVFKDALNLVGKIKNLIKRIPREVNIVCKVVEVILAAIKKMTDFIGDIQKKIFSKIPEFMEKIKALINFVNDIAMWFTNVVIKKGIGIITAALDFVSKIGKALPAAISTVIFIPIQTIFQTIISFLKLPFKEFFFTIVDMLTNIPKFFDTVADGMRKICKIIQDAMDAALNVALGPALKAKKIAEAAWKAFKAATSFGGGGGSTIMFSGGLERILLKNNNELSSLIYTYENTPSHKRNDNYMDKLERLIKEKNKKIKKIHKLLIKYNKNKQLLIKN